MTNYRIAMIVLVCIFLISLVKLGVTLSEWHPHYKYLSSLESKLSTVLQQELGYSANQRKYLNSDQNHKDLDIWYCDDFECMDSLKQFWESQLQTSFAEAYPNYSRIFVRENNSWQKLNVLLRMRELNKLFHDLAFGADYSGFPIYGRFVCKIFNDTTVGIIPYYRDITYNDLLSINGSEFKVDSSKSFHSALLSDTLRVTYFHDNFSYGYGRDSILKEYVYDISHLKEE